MRKDTALLVIDVQVGLVEGPQPSYHHTQILENIGQLLTEARRTETPIIFLQHDGEPGSRLAIDTPGWRIHPSVAPLISETVLRKRASDSFYRTGLQEELQKRGIKQLVIAGYRTEMCIDTTSRIAISRGYDVTLVKDAHSTTDSGVLSAAQIVDHHNDTLDDFGTDEHVIVIKATDEVAFQTPDTSP